MYEGAWTFKAPTTQRVHVRCLSTSGLEIGYDEYGEGDPLLLVMGIAASRVAWPPAFCRQLAGRGFRVITPDNRDVGESTWLNEEVVPSIGLSILQRATRRKVVAPYTISDMAADLIGLLDALKLPSAHVVGASLGGMIAQTWGPTTQHGLPPCATHPSEARADVPRRGDGPQRGHVSDPWW